MNEVTDYLYHSAYGQYHSHVADQSLAKEQTRIEALYFQLSTNLTKTLSTKLIADNKFRLNDYQIAGISESIGRVLDFVERHRS